MPIRTALTVLCAVILFAGPASGAGRYSIDLSGLVVQMKQAGSGKVAVAVSDDRAIVAKNEQPQQFVGFIRDGLGRPTAAHTKSGKPLAEDLTASIAASLKTAGYEPVPVIVEQGTEQTEIAKRLHETGAPRSVVLLIRVLQSDSLRNTSLYHNLALVVLDENQQEMANTRVKGELELGAPEGGQNGIPAQVADAVKSKLAELLNHKYVSEKLKPQVDEISPAIP